MSNCVNQVCKLFMNEGENVRVVCPHFSSYSQKDGVTVQNVGLVYNRLYSGGAERVLSLLAQLLCDEFNIYVILDEINEEKDYFLPDNVIKIKISPENEVWQSKDYYKRALDFQKVINEFELDIICFNGMNSRILLYDAILAKLNGVAVVGIKHEMFSQQMSEQSLVPCWQRDAFMILDRLVVLSDVEKKYWRALGVNAIYFPNPIGEYAISEKKDKTTDIIWVGRLSELQKQYLDVIPIIKAVREKIPLVKLRIYGGEDIQGSGERFVERIEEEGLHGNIEYCGYVSGNMGDIYGGARIMLVTSLYETFPMNIFEAKVNGLPIVSYEMPYVELLKDKDSFVEVEQGNYQMAADAIVDLLKNDVKFNAISQRAKDSVKKFTDDKLKEKWVDLLKNIFCVFEDSQDTVTQNDLTVIINSILTHYKKGVENGRQRHSEEIRWVISQRDNELLKRRVIRAISRYIDSNISDIIICSFGMYGRRVKEILNNEGIYEAYVADNQIITDIENYISIDDAINTLGDKYYYLICSTKYGDEIHNQISKKISEDNIIDLYLVF